MVHIHNIDKYSCRCMSAGYINYYAVISQRIEITQSSLVLYVPINHEEYDTRPKGSINLRNAFRSRLKTLC